MSDEFRFKEERNRAVFTCVHVLDGAPILLVSYDNDGDWQFLCGERHTTEEGKVVCLDHIVELDPSVNELAELPPCHEAEREHSAADWEQYDPTEQLIREHVEEEGWFVALIDDEGDGPGSRFAYSIGMHETIDHPEVIVTGQPVDLMGFMVNEIGARARDGTRYAAGDRIDGLIEGFPCILKRMHITHYRDYLGYGLWYYDGPEFPVLQLFWPDKNGHFPWEPGYSYGPEQQPDLTTMKRED